MDMTGEVSDIYMTEWDKELIKKMQEKSIEVKLYKRYKDDINAILDPGSIRFRYHEFE